MSINLARSLIVGISLLFLLLERLSLTAGLFIYPHLLALVALGFLVHKEYCQHSQHSLATFYQSFYFLGMLLSSLLITGGVPMIEIGKDGTPNGTFWVLVIFYVVGASASVYGFEVKFAIKSGRRRLGETIEKNFVFGLSILVILSSLAVLLAYSNPYSLGIGRVEYWNSVIPSHLSWVNSAVRQTMLFPILLFYISRENKVKRRIASILVIAYLLITVIMLGEKVSAFTLHTSTWLVALSAYRGRLDVNLKTSLLFLCAAGSIYGLLSYNYRVADYGDAFIITRIGLQAQVLWSVLNVPEFPFFQQATSACFWGCGAASAADYISLQYLPTYLYEIYTETGSTLSGFMPGLPILAFGFIGALVLHGLVSFLLGLVASHLVSQLREKNLVYSFLVFKLYFAFILYWYAAIHTALHSIVFFVTILLVGYVCLLGGATKKQMRSEATP